MYLTNFSSYICVQCMLRPEEVSVKEFPFKAAISELNGYFTLQPKANDLRYWWLPGCQYETVSHLLQYVLLRQQ